jgi:hypothetical protein
MVMPAEMLFYVDDSGSRHADRDPEKDPHGVDWYALGGVLIKSTDKLRADSMIGTFRQGWPALGDEPLHSCDIRSGSRRFGWLRSVPSESRSLFHSDIEKLVHALPIVVHGCVVDRPGYNARYGETYGDKRWSLCRSAFAMSVERAAKFARSRGCRLRVLMERSDKKTERRFKRYYDELIDTGAPFNPKRSEPHKPLTNVELSETLVGLETRSKRSLLMQVADIVLWPICRGGYDPENRSFRSLQAAGKLLDAHCDAESGLQGIKMFCFDGAK